MTLKPYKAKAAFLDRDGVINKDPGYLHKIADFEFTDGCIAGLRLLEQAGYALIIVTNQSGIGRGYYTEKDYQNLTAWYLEQLSLQGVNITGVFHCPHAPEDNCDCRKPKAGLFFQALKQFPGIQVAESLMIGDKVSDLDAAASAGVAGLFFMSAATGSEHWRGWFKNKDYADRVQGIGALGDMVRFI